MRVAAFSLAGVDMESVGLYRSDLVKRIRKSEAEIIVLPAYSSLVLGLGVEAFRPGLNFSGTLYTFSVDASAWNDIFLELHGAVARETSTYLAAGTTVEAERGSYYLTAYCFGPDGKLCCRQRQTHLTAEERALDFSRGEELELFELYGRDGTVLKCGLVSGNDARHPEVGRILALQGAGIILHSGAMEAGLNCWAQAAGTWAQVQQNQFWAVEAQLCAGVADCKFAAGSAVIGPCGVTLEGSGYLARGLPGAPVVTGDLDERKRRAIMSSYPLLELLNRSIYESLEKKAGFISGTERGSAESGD